MSKMYAILADGEPYVFTEDRDKAMSLAELNRERSPEIDFKVVEGDYDDGHFTVQAQDAVADVAEEAAEVAEEAAEAIEEHKEEVAEAIAENIEEAAEEAAEIEAEHAEAIAEVAEEAAEEATEAEAADDGVAEAAAAEEAVAAAEVVVEQAVETLPPEDVPPKVSHWWYRDRMQNHG